MLRFGWFPFGWFEAWVISFGLWALVYWTIQLIKDYRENPAWWKEFFAPLPMPPDSEDEED